MLTAPPVNHLISTERVLANFLMSDLASHLINTKNSSWAEAIDLLIQHQCYADAAILITQKLPMQDLINWCEWSISRGDDSTINSDVFSNNSQIGDTLAELLKDQDSNSSSVWFTAANFWMQQFESNSEAYLEDLVREAVYSSITLAIRKKQNSYEEYDIVLRKGQGLLNE